MKHLPTRRRLVLAAGVVLLAALFVIGCIRLDGQVDRARPMFADFTTVSRLEYDLLHDGEPGVEVSLDSSSAPVTINGVTFTPSSGVRIVAKSRGDSMCIRASNQFGDQSGWSCVNGKGPRPGASE